IATEDAIASEDVEAAVGLGIPRVRVVLVVTTNRSDIGDTIGWLEPQAFTISLRGGAHVRVQGSLDRHGSDVAVIERGLRNGGGGEVEVVGLASIVRSAFEQRMAVNLVVLEPVVLGDVR